MAHGACLTASSYRGRVCSCCAPVDVSAPARDRVSIRISLLRRNHGQCMVWRHESLGLSPSFSLRCSSAISLSLRSISMSIGKESQSFFTAFILCAIAITVVSSARKRAESAVRAARNELEVRVKERTAELEQSNREIQESERQLRQLTEAIPQQIWRADGSGNVEYCNGHLLAFLGQPMAHLQGESFFHIFHATDEPLIRRGWRTALRSNSTFEAEARVRSADGSYRWFLVRAVPQMDGGGTVARWYGIHIDIEEQRRAQHSLAEAQLEQSRISHLLSLAEMAASIAHELNQPLTAVVTHAYACREWLREDAPNIAKASATAEKIVRESTRASAVVSRVRALFRKEVEARELTDMNGLIRGVERLLRDEAIRRDVSIRLMLADRIAKAQSRSCSNSTGAPESGHEWNGCDGWDLGTAGIDHPFVPGEHGRSIDID